MLSLLVAAYVGTTPAAQTAPAPPRKVPAVLPAVVARVNGEEIKKEDVEFVIVQTSSRSWAQIPPYERDSTLSDALDHLIEQTLQWQEAQARGITVEASEIVKWQHRPVSVISMDMGSSKTTTERQRAAVDLFKNANANLSVSAIKRMIGAAKLWEAHVAVPDASDADVKDFYAKFVDMFKEEEAVRENHIFIETAPAAGATARAKARQRIDALLKRVAGEDFDTLARQYSEDASARGGGDQNWVSRDDLRELGSAAFAMTPGQVSDVITTGNGYYIMKVLARRPARTVPFEEATPQIKNVLKFEKAGPKVESWQTLIEGLKQKAKIEVLI